VAELRFMSRNINHRLVDHKTVEVVDVLARRNVNVACVQVEAQVLQFCYNSYKRFRVGAKDRVDGVGVFVAEKWVENLVKVDRISGRIIVLKTILGDSLVTPHPMHHI